ncbi:hypothetical protein M422DRAFT_246247 [Sphaerobolus stellatus SS14]|nr:hypothetical protein M422DRAFT_246247 [Sphaerobolus stellatus SS14]
MEQMKVVFGSRDNFDTAFSGFATNLLKLDHEATMWITDSSTPLRIGTHIVKGRPPKSQDTKPERLPTGPDFLALVLEHCALTRAQIYGQIIPYMIRHEAKRACSCAGSERAAYMHLNQCPPAPHKGKRPVTASLQSRLSAHALTPVQTGESSHQRLDEDLDNYNQVHDPVIPYEEPPSSEPMTGEVAPTVADANSSLPDENSMDIDQIVMTKTKVEHYKTLACKTLVEHESSIWKDADAKSLSEVIKNQVNFIKKKYNMHPDMLSQIGQGLIDEGWDHEIQDGSELANIWDKIQADFPWYETLNQLLGRSPVVDKEDSKNSISDMDLSVLGNRGAGRHGRSSSQGSAASSAFGDNVPSSPEHETDADTGDDEDSTNSHRGSPSYDEYDVDTLDPVGVFAPFVGSDDEAPCYGLILMKGSEV